MDTAVYNKENFVREFSTSLRYIFFGMLTTIVNYAVFFVAIDIAKISYAIANVVALGVSVMFAFVVNKQFVFASKSWKIRVVSKELVAFLSARGIVSVADIFGMWLMVSVLSVSPKMAKILVNIIVIALNYIFSKIFVFRDSQR